MNQDRPTIDYATRGATSSTTAQTGWFSLALGSISAVMQFLLWCGIFTGDAPFLATVTILFLICAAFGFGIAGVINRSPGAWIGLMVAACDLAGVIGMGIYFIGNLPRC